MAVLRLALTTKMQTKMQTNDTKMQTNGGAFRRHQWTSERCWGRRAVRSCDLAGVNATYSVVEISVCVSLKSAGSSKTATSFPGTTGRLPTALENEDDIRARCPRVALRRMAVVEAAVLRTPT